MRHSKIYDVDGLMWNTLSSLLHDFRSFIPASLSRILDDIIVTKDIKAMRGIEFNHFMNCDAETYKRVYQLIALFKRIIFKDDILSQTELVASATEKFKATQVRLETLSDLSEQAQDLLFWGRGLTHHILGDFSNAELLAACEFGKHAAVGVPFRKANLQSKWETITGSAADVEWFESDYLGFNRLLCDFVKEEHIEYTVVDRLKLTFVPKSFKACRAITPNTTVGSLRTDGLGKMIAARLKEHGLDISVLQEKHRAYAQIGSRDDSLVTCDQRSASDNITGWLLERLLPKLWYKELNRGRITNISFADGTTVKSETFCTMGVGFTFPLQTLVFYVLAKSISLKYFDGTDFVSCYGDDLICSPRLWPFIRDLFPEFGLEINEDKTFFEGSFRESCGGDYYRGMDVRPFQPEGAGTLNRVSYESFIYKLINGLRRRWEDDEIKGTLAMLLALNPEFLVVPKDFPDVSGIKCERGDYIWSQRTFIRNRNGSAVFSYLKHKVLEVECRYQVPYYCQSLRHGAVDRFSIRVQKHKSFVPLPGTGPFQKVRGVSILL